MPKINKNKQANTFVIKNERLRNMELSDMPTRFISFMGDAAGMCMAIYIWVLIILLIVSGIVSFKYYDIISNMMLVLITISMYSVNTALMVQYKGQSFGKRAMELRVVSTNNKQVLARFLWMRVVIGFALPFTILYLLLGVIGVGAYIIVNGILVLADPLHRSIIDFVFKTKVVMIEPSIIQAMPQAAHNPIIEEPIKQASNEIDMHVYSTFSYEGTREVEDLFCEAKALGIRTFSICDHNSIKANAMAMRLAPLYGIQYIAGSNFDCVYEGKHINILGYGMDDNEDRFHRIEYENIMKEKASSLRRIELLEGYLGIHIDSERLMNNNRHQRITNEDIAKQILSDPLNETNEVIKPYIVNDKAENKVKAFVNDFFAVGKVAHVSMVYPDAKDIIALIHASNGKAIIAHPMHTFRNDEELLGSLTKDVDGLEFFTPHHSKEDILYLLQMCANQQHLVCAGSKYNGQVESQFEFGETGCFNEVEEAIKETVNRITTK